MRVARVLLRLSAPALVTLGLLAAPAAHAAVPGLVGAYGFEEATGTVATDTSGAGNAGAIAGATRSAAGRFGAALSFDGVDDRVNVADSNSLDLSPAMTLSAWVRPTNTDWRTVLIKERPGGLAYALYASTETNRPSAEVATSGTFEARGTAMLPASAWSHLTTTYDGATLRLYVNGAQVATRAVSGSIAVSSGALRIGGNAIWGEYFRGLIDEVRVYNRALSVAELQGDMNAPVAAPGPGADTTPPSRPTGLTATRVSDDITLSWTAATDNVGVTGYRIFRGSTQIGTTTGALSFADDDRPTGTYSYTVQAVDAAGNASAASDPASVTVGDIVPPTAPANVQGSSGGLRVDLTWGPATDNLGVTGYRIHRSSVSGFTPDATNRVATLGVVLSHRETVAYPGVYYYRVVAADADANTTASPQVTVTVPGSPPIAPTNLTSSTVGSELRLTWNQPSHYYPVTFRVYRSISDPGFTPDQTNLIGTSSTPSFADPTAPAGTLHYAVIAVDTAGVASNASRISTALGPDVTPPVVTITHGCSYGTIHDYVPIYTSVVDDRPGTTRRILIDGEPAHMPQGADWESRSVANGPHVLSVVGRDAAGNEATASCDIVVHNPTVTANFAAPSDGATVRGLVTLQLDPRADGEPLSGGNMTWLGVTISGGGSASGSGVQKTRTWDTTKVPNGVYTIRLDVGWMDYSNPRATKTISVTVDNTLPAVTGVTAVPSGTGARVSWDAAPADAGVTGYRVHRGTSADFTPSDGNRVAAPTTTSYTDADLAPGSYFYTIVAVAGAQISAPSAAAEVTITPDTVAPVVGFTNAACNGHTVFDYVDPLTVSTSDDRGGALTLEVFVDDTRIRGPITIPAGQSGYMFQWNTRSHTDGEHTMKLVARDGAGNEGTFNCLWTVDNKELTVPIVVTDSPVSGTVTVRFQPKADGVDVTTPVAVSIDGVSVFSRASGPYEYTWDTTQATNGPHTIEARMFWMPYNQAQATSIKQVTVENTAPPAPTGLVAAYGFEETSATTVTDSSPLGSNGTISGATRTAAGRFGGALSFDGVNDLVNVPDANSLDLTTGMTLSAWVRPTALGDWRTVLMKSRSGGLAYALYAHTDTNRPAGVIQTASEQDARGGTSQLPMDAWTHLATTYDGANVRLYINGALAATRAASGAITVSAGALQIGGNSVWSEWFKGLIDEVRVYERALTAAEIAADRDRPVVASG